MVPAHRSKFAGGQMVERQVNRAAPTVARLRGDISLCDDLEPVDVRIVPSFRPAVFRLLRPAQKAIHGALRAIPIPKKQAETKGPRLLSRASQGCAQRPLPNQSIGEIAVHRLAGEIVPCGVFRVPTDSGYEFVDKGKVLVHRHVSSNANDTIRSITSASGNPAAAIILG
jgi:hypothetical protein